MNQSKEETERNWKEMAIELKYTLLEEFKHEPFEKYKVVENTESLLIIQNQSHKLCIQFTDYKYLVTIWQETLKENQWEVTIEKIAYKYDWEDGWMFEYGVPSREICGGKMGSTFVHSEQLVGWVLNSFAIHS